MSEPLQAYSCAEGKRRAALICKLAMQTVPRWGRIGFLFVTLGLYFALYTCCLLLNFCAEMLAPWEYEGTSTGEISLEKVTDIDEVMAVTPVISFDSTLAWGNYTQDVSILCVTADYLDLKFEKGSSFPEDSSMPFLIMNSWAVAHFCDEDGEQVREAANTGDILTMVVQDESYSATISGIFYDGEDRATVYMSYFWAAKISPVTDNFLVRLKQRGSLEKSALLLEEQGIRISYNDTELLRWEMMENQLLQTSLCSIVLFICGLLRIRQRPSFTQQETQLLKLSGMTKADIQWVCLLRTTFAYSGCLLLSLGVGACFGQVSLLGLAICLCFLPITIIGVRIYT